jgi:hypothetical protein
MKFANRLASYLIALALIALAVAIFTTPAPAQDDSWWIVRAEYGTRSQHSDVTGILQDLIARGGVNGRVAVNNQTMGGDPAVGADKTLHIFARNARNDTREFDFKEGSFLPAGLFNVRRDDWEQAAPNRGGGNEHRDSNGLRILRAYYGVQGKTVDVTEFLRTRVRDDSLSLLVTNRAFGGDPAIGADKVLIVVYRYQGMETATAVREGNTLTLP